MKVNKLSVIIPSFNEADTILEVIKSVKDVNLGKIKKEIIVVDDGSTDRTKHVLSEIKVKSEKLIVLRHRENLGKGASIKTALKRVTGDVIVIQDADLEYNPNDYKLLLKPIIESNADVVFGSRFISNQPHRILYFWHNIGNNLLTLLSNILTNLNLTDMETGYKMFTKRVADKLNLKENRFGFEPEFTAKVAKMNIRIYEVGVSYSGRTYQEGKKIKGVDGLLAIWQIIKFNLFS